MKFLCLCPVYNHRQPVTEAAVQCFLDQTHTDATLLIMDDRPQTLPPGSYYGGRVLVATMNPKFPNMPEKYNYMVNIAEENSVEFDAVAIWDDDDLFLPKHLEWHNKVLEAGHKWSYPTKVLSTYGSAIREEETGNRFWSSIAFTKQALREMDGFGDTKEVSFDQQVLQRLRNLEEPGVPEYSGYVYMWHLTFSDHASGHSQGHTCTLWYDRCAVTIPTGPLTAGYTDEAVWVFSEVKNSMPQYL